MIKIAIGIQLRKNNSRLPDKALKTINGKDLIFYMIDNVYKGIEKINKHKHRNNTECSIFILVPDQELEFWKDKLKSYKHKYFAIISGSESDVLSRYDKLVDYDPSYIMRLTGDCPFIPFQLITKTINTMVNKRLDYLSNVDEPTRTMPDGFDVEIMSIEAFNWLSENARKNGTDQDLEHVTTYLRANKQAWMNFGMLFYVYDISDQKYSIDTLEDFELVKKIVLSRFKKEQLARKKGYGIYEY